MVLSTDLSTGVVDRFRTLPMWRPAVLVGRSLADLMTAAICATIVCATGIAIGWRPEAGVLSALGGFGVFLLFSYAFSWACACLGTLSKGPELAQGVGLVVLFPLAFVSNSLVPTQHMPVVLRTIANWNPVSAVTAAAREMFGNPNPSASIQRVADAASRGRDARLVVRTAPDVRAAHERPLSPPHRRVTRHSSPA